MTQEWTTEDDKALYAYLHRLDKEARYEEWQMKMYAALEAAAVAFPFVAVFFGILILCFLSRKGGL